MKNLGMTRRSSAPCGKPEKWEYDKIANIPNKEIYINAWIELNCGFLDRYKKIKGSIKNKFEHFRGKKWKNIQKMCPRIRYKDFVDNANSVLESRTEEWELHKQYYVLSRVSQLPYKNCIF